MKRIIIAGLPRCGTTLLANLLHAQQGCLFIGEWLNAFEQLADAMHVRFDQPLGVSQRRAALLKVREQLLILRHVCLVTVQDFDSLNGLHRAAFADIAGTAIVAGHKAMLDPSRVRRLLRETDIHVAILFRDPRDAAVSWWYRTGSTPEQYLDDWRGMARFALASRHSRLHVVRFEDMVTSPERALGPLLQAVGLQLRLPSSLTMFRNARSDDTWQPNTAHADVTRVLDPSALERWRRSPESPVVRYASWVCRREIVQLAYAAPGRLETRQRAAFMAMNLTHRMAALMRRTALGAASAVERVVPRLEHVD